eukprot:TRINITY_DN467_c0_g1_i3.p3 TRINITY_DN467_c0_g1~~TRINITY_DN467_c0_g1_i3.p3  ORF type:complete len:103 (+),score=10.40 TRINITY_DN467_c0_g1_i3:320-628(+)
MASLLYGETVCCYQPTSYRVLSQVLNTYTLLLVIVEAERNVDVDVDVGIDEEAAGRVGGRHKPRVEAAKRGVDVVRSRERWSGTDIEKPVRGVGFVTSRDGG